MGPESASRKEIVPGSRRLRLHRLSRGSRQRAGSAETGPGLVHAPKVDAPQLGHSHGPMASLGSEPAEAARCRPRSLRVLGTTGGATRCTHQLHPRLGRGAGGVCVPGSDRPFARPRAESRNLHAGPIYRRNGSRPLPVGWWRTAPPPAPQAQWAGVPHSLDGVSLKDLAHLVVCQVSGHAGCCQYQAPE